MAETQSPHVLKMLPTQPQSWLVESRPGPGTLYSPICSGSDDVPVKWHFLHKSVCAMLIIGAALVGMNLRSSGNPLSQHPTPFPSGCAQPILSLHFPRAEHTRIRVSRHHGLPMNLSEYLSVGYLGGSYRSASTAYLSNFDEVPAIAFLHLARALVCRALPDHTYEGEHRTAENFAFQQAIVDKQGEMSWQTTKHANKF